MDLISEIRVIQEKIDTLTDKRGLLRKRELEGIITGDEKINLDTILEKLEDLRGDKKEYFKLAQKNEPSLFKSFKDADQFWIQNVTGVNTTYRKWTSYAIDDSIQPRPGFKITFDEISKSFHQENEAGRRIFLNLFLSDIILRPEFDGVLRIFPELELSVETFGPKKLKLKGRMDYTVGLGRNGDIFDFAIPREIHLVAVEAKTSIGQRDLWQCIAEAASLYKIRLDAGKGRKSIWGILSNARIWQFIFIDENGLLWQSDDYSMDLRSYDEFKVLQVYRIVYYIIKCCFEASTSPPSRASSGVSLV